jgi:hypothetical protein
LTWTSENSKLLNIIPAFKRPNPLPLFSHLALENTPGTQSEFEIDPVPILIYQGLKEESKMIIAYALGYGLNRKWFLPKYDPEFFCPQCGSKKLWDYVNRGFKLTQRADITETVDGFSIVSKHFRDVVTKFQMVRERRQIVAQVKRSEACGLIHVLV